MRRRDEADFTEFAAAAIGRLRRTAYLMCGDWHRAEDAAQDALVPRYRRWDKLNRQHGLNTYAHKTVVSVGLDEGNGPGGANTRLLNQLSNCATTAPQPSMTGRWRWPRSRNWPTASEHVSSCGTTPT